MTSASDGFVALVPLKPLQDAKSRMSLPAQARYRLACAIASDTVDAVRACPAISGVVVVTDDPDARDLLRRPGVEFAPDATGGGMARAVDAAHALVSARRSGCGTVVVPADLPALTPQALSATLAHVQAGPACFVRDARGDGTTLLARAVAFPLSSQYGRGSARRHLLAGARELLDAPACVRADVDVLEDLDVAAHLGVGAATSAWLADAPPEARPLSKHALPAACCPAR